MKPIVTVGKTAFTLKRGVYVNGNLELRLPPNARTPTELVHIPTGVKGRGKTGEAALEDLRSRLSLIGAQVKAALKELEL